MSTCNAPVAQSVERRVEASKVTRSIRVGGTMTGDWEYPVVSHIFMDGVVYWYRPARLESECPLKGIEGSIPLPSATRR